MSAIDNLTPVPDQPEISEGNQTFHAKAYALYKWMREKLAPAISELRDMIVNAVTGAFTGSSVTSVTIVDTGEVSIITDTGRSFKPGTPARLASIANPLNFIDGVTKTYDETTGAYTMFAQAKNGSGTFADWSLSIIPSGGGLASLGSNTFTGNQFVPDDAYDATGWNNSNAVPTKNAIRDKIESIINSLFSLETSATDSTFISNSSAKASSPSWVRGLIASFNKTATSNALTSSFLQAIPHGLGRVPVIESISLVFNTAINNWQIGDEIFNWVDGVTSVSDSFISVGAGGTSILVSCKSPTIATFDKTSNATVAIPVANFNVRIYYR